MKVIDCRSEEGITLGLVDAILSIGRILADRDLLISPAVSDALRDLATDEDIAYLIRLGSTDRPTD